MLMGRRSGCTTKIKVVCTKDTRMADLGLDKLGRRGQRPLTLFRAHQLQDMWRDETGQRVWSRINQTMWKLIWEWADQGLDERFVVCVLYMTVTGSPVSPPESLLFKCHQVVNKTPPNTTIVQDLIPELTTMPKATQAQ